MNQINVELDMNVDSLVNPLNELGIVILCVLAMISRGTLTKLTGERS